MMVEWFSCWTVSASRYRKALTDRRRAQKAVNKLHKYTRQLYLEAATTADKVRKRRDEKQKEHDESLKEARNTSLESFHTLNDERLRFIEELTAKDQEIEQLKLDMRLLKSDYAAAERDKENLAISNELVRAELEAYQAKCSAQKTKYLREETRPSVGGIL